VGGVNGAVCAEFSEEVVFEVVEVTMETNGLVVYVGEDGAFGAFPEHEGGRQRDFLTQTEGGVVFP
jgi:hypothetical protein